MVKFSNNNKNLGACKQMKIQFLVLNEKIKYQLVSIDYFETYSMLVDFLMKVISLSAYSGYIYKMGSINSLDNMICI